VNNKWGKECAITGVKNKLEAHHIKSKSTSPELEYDSLNGVTLCKEIHAQFHKEYGRKYNTVYQLIEFGRKKGVDLIPRLRELNKIEINSELLQAPAPELLDPIQT